MKPNQSAFGRPSEMDDDLDSVEAMLAEANQAVEDGMAEEAAFARQQEEDAAAGGGEPSDGGISDDGSLDAAFDAALDAAFNELDEYYAAGGSDDDDDARSDGTAAGSDFDQSDQSDEFARILRRPMLIPKRRLKNKVQSEEVAGSASHSNPWSASAAQPGNVLTAAANPPAAVVPVSPFSTLPALGAPNSRFKGFGTVPATSIPGLKTNPLWAGTPIPSTSRVAVDFMKSSTFTVPALSEASNQESVAAARGITSAWPATQQRFPSNPYGAGTPIPSGTHVAVDFMKSTFTVPALAEASNLESVADAEGAARARQAQADLAQVRQNLIAAGVREACLKADVRRMGEEIAAVKELAATTAAEKDAVEELAATAAAEKDAVKADLGKAQQQFAAFKEYAEAEFSSQLDRNIAEKMVEMEAHCTAKMAEMEAHCTAKMVDSEAHCTALIQSNAASRADLETQVSKELQITRGALDAARVIANDLNKEVKELNKANVQLHHSAELGNKEKDNALRKLLEAESHINDVLRHQAEDQAEIARLEKKIADMDRGKFEDKYIEACGQLRRATDKCSAYQKDYHESQTNLGAVRAELGQRDSMIARLRAEAGSTENTISGLNQTIQDMKGSVYEASLATARAEASRDERVRKAREDMALVAQERDHIDTMLNERNEQLNALKADYDTARVHIVQLESALGKERILCKAAEDEAKRLTSTGTAMHKFAGITDKLRGRKAKGLPNPPHANKLPVMGSLGDELLRRKLEEDSSLESLSEEEEEEFVPKPKKKQPWGFPPSGPRSSLPSSGSDLPMGRKSKRISGSADLFSPKSLDFYKTESKDPASGAANPYIPKLESEDSARNTEEIQPTIQYVDKIVTRTVHQARNPLLAFFYVFIDLWTILITYLAHQFPGITAWNKRIFPKLTGFICAKVLPHPEGLSLISRASILALATKLKRALLGNLFSHATLPVSAPRTAVKAEPTGLPTVTYKLPPLWPNLTMATFYLTLAYAVYESYYVLGERDLWLSSNEATRRAVSEYWGKGGGGDPYSAGSEGWFAGWGFRFADASVDQWVLPG